MASIREEIAVEVSPAKVWAVVRDVGAIHQRLVRGFVTDCRLEGDARIVTFANGLVVRELIVDVDDGARRLVWSATGGNADTPQRVAADLRRGREPQPARLDRRPHAE